MRLRGDDFVSYAIICRVCAAGTHAFADVKIPACVSATPPHTLRTEPAEEGVSNIIDEPKFQFFN